MSIVGGIRDEGTSTVSLDVLAHVAAATLEENEDVKVQNEAVEPEYTIAGGQDLPVEILAGIQSLTLEAIQSLSAQAILHLFARATRDPLNHVFTLTCAFQPGKCARCFSSLGSEEAASIHSMKSHMARHLFELLRDADQDPSLLHEYHYTVFGEPAEKERPTKVEVESVVKRETPPPIQEPSVGLESVVIFSASSSSSPNEEIVTDPGQVAFGIQALTDQLVSVPEPPVIQVPEPTVLQASVDQQLEEEEEEEEEAVEEPVVLEEVSDEEVVAFPEMEVEIVTETDSHHHLAPKRFLLPKTAKPKAGIRRPIPPDLEDEVSRFDHDHAYFHNQPDPDSDPEDVKPEQLSHQFPRMDRHIQPARPLQTSQFIQATEEKTGNVVFLPIVNDQIIVDSPQATTYIISEDAEILTAMPKQPAGGGLAVTTFDNQAARRSEYPPMPHSNFGTVKLYIREEWEPTTAEEERNIEEDQRILLGSNQDYDDEVKDEEWIKRTALKHIRYLRGRKKKDNYVLSCRICNDGKVFTAAATLLYHYRSHAGIKAFICQICNTSFTRQHSLNYHMLIHNGQSRFSCDICSRQFRHPQHYKEHLRRHTGETPFSCDDCGSTFKTRNTFKRHLRTRHGKLLTANGIRSLSEAEIHMLKIKEIKRHEDRAMKAHEVKMMAVKSQIPSRTQTQTATQTQPQTLTQFQAEDGQS